VAIANARPDLIAHQKVVRMKATEVAQHSVELLGGRLAAYVAGVSETRAVRQWAEGDRDMRPDSEARLREALTVAITLATTDSTGIVQAWFQGLNPQLDDRSPAWLLREGNIEKVGPEVRQAARAFVTGG